MDTQVALANCYFDGCAGLVFGAGCKNNGDASCPAEIEELIQAAIAAGIPPRTSGRAILLAPGSDCLDQLGVLCVFLTLVCNLCRRKVRNSQH